MKKLAFMIISLTLVLTCLCACQQAQDTPAESTEGIESGPEQTADPTQTEPEETEPEETDSSLDDPFDFRSETLIRRCLKNIPVLDFSRFTAVLNQKFNFEKVIASKPSVDVNNSYSRPELSGIQSITEGDGILAISYENETVYFTDYKEHRFKIIEKDNSFAVDSVSTLPEGVPSYLGLAFFGLEQVSQAFYDHRSAYIAMPDATADMVILKEQKGDQRLITFTEEYLDLYAQAYADHFYTDHPEKEEFLDTFQGSITFKGRYPEFQYGTLSIEFEAYNPDIGAQTIYKVLFDDLRGEQITCSITAAMDWNGVIVPVTIETFYVLNTRKSEVDFFSITTKVQSIPTEIDGSSLLQDIEYKYSIENETSAPSDYCISQTNTTTFRSGDHVIDILTKKFSFFFCENNYSTYMINHNNIKGSTLSVSLSMYLADAIDTSTIPDLTQIMDDYLKSH